MSIDLTAPMMYAKTLDMECAGKDACHWCGAPCERVWVHDEPRAAIGVKRPWSKRPGSHWICAGCYMFRRQRVTINFLSGGFRDGQCPMSKSWIITDSFARVIHHEQDKHKLYELLCNPPLRFVLSITSNINNLHAAPINNHKEILADTPIRFYQDGVVMYYNVYELKEALTTGLEGKRAGVRFLMEWLNPPRPVIVEEKRDRGRPPALDDGKITKKKVR